MSMNSQGNITTQNQTSVSTISEHADSMLDRSL